MRVERGDDRSSDGGQEVVEVPDDGAVLGTVFEEFFALEDRCVVLFDLRGDGATGPFRGICYNASVTELLSILNVGSISVNLQ